MAGGRVVAPRRIAHELPDGLLRVDADDGVNSARHAEIRDVARALGQYLGVGSLHMGVRSPDGARSAVKQKAHCTLLARSFGVEIDKYDLFPDLLHEAVGDDKWVVGVGVERKATHKTEYAHVAEGGLVDVDAPPRTLWRKVCGAQYAAALVEVGTQLRACPCVVAEGYNVRPRLEYCIRLSGGYADDVCVFAVDDAEINVSFGFEFFQLGI